MKMTTEFDEVTRRENQSGERIGPYGCIFDADSHKVGGVRIIKKRGRPSIYETDEERHAAKLQKTFEAKKRKKQQQIEFLNRINDEQHFIINKLDKIILDAAQCDKIISVICPGLFAKDLNQK
jgi:hypothetical protein